MEYQLLTHKAGTSKSSTLKTTTQGRGRGLANYHPGQLQGKHVRGIGRCRRTPTHACLTQLEATRACNIAQQLVHSAQAVAVDDRSTQTPRRFARTYLRFECVRAHLNVGESLRQSRRSINFLEPVDPAWLPPSPPSSCPSP